MADGSRTVLKKHEIRLSQNASPPAAPPPHGQVPAGTQVRIVEQTDAHAVLEVACSCGRKTRIRCKYDVTGTAPSAGAEAAGGS